jgi:asparagine synthase (glutamine-hydrolysing)
VLSGALGPEGVVCDAPASAEHGSLLCFLDGQDIEATRLAKGFAERGERVLEELHGRFVVVLWDADRREGLVAVDRLASRPLFYRQSGRSLQFAGELRDLLDTLPSTPGPSADTVARWLSSGTLEPDESLYDGVDRLPGGHLLRWQGERSERARYWQPRYEPPLRVERDEAAELIRAGITAAVKARTTGRCGVLLSGGLDSTSVAAIVRRATGELPAYSATFPDQPEADESALIAATSAELSLPWRPTPARAEGVMAATLEHIRTWRAPPPAPTLFFQMPVIRSAAADGVTVLFDGQGGDELFGAAPYLLADRLRRGRIGSLRSLARTLPGFGPAPEGRLVVAAIRSFGVAGAAPLWANRLRHAHDDRYWAWKRLDGPRWWAALADQLTAGRERVLAHEYLRRKFAAGKIVGAHPYFDDIELIELMLRIPPELSFDPIYDRPLLREAVRGLIPEQVRLRVDKSRFDAPVMAALTGPDFRTIRALLGAHDARVRRYTTPEVLARAVEGPRAQRDSSWARAAFRLASTEQWLRLLDGATSSGQ